jgi:hypothetical protein
MDNKENLRNSKLDHSLLGANIDYTADNVVKEYVLVTSTSVMPYFSNGSVKKAGLGLVDLMLRRLSDGIESRFVIKAEVNNIRRFINAAKENESIHYLKGKVIDAYYINNNIVQIKINKHALLSESESLFYLKKKDK